MLASVTVELGAGVDVPRIVFASRRAEERYFAWEQPDRDGFALGALGTAWTVERRPRATASAPPRASAPR